MSEQKKSLEFEVTTQDITKLLLDNQDLKYRGFHARLMPSVPRYNIMGVRTPVLRKIAKDIKNDSCKETFLKNLPHRYYEENNLHAFLIEQIKDYDECIAQLNRFLPYVDNWATCDSMNPKCFKKHTEELLCEIDKWIASGEEYTLRFAIKQLMTFFLEERFAEKYLITVSQIKSDKYYVNMMIAWYFATALAKQYDATLPYIEERRLSVWIHNKTIQKAVESFRISDSRKEHLKRLRIKVKTDE